MPHHFTAEKHRSAKLSGELTSVWAHQPEGFNTDGFYLLPTPLEEGARAVLVGIGDVLVLRESRSPSDVNPIASVFMTAVSMRQRLMLSSPSVCCFSELSGSRGNL